jgi:hypothetical protein
MPPYWNPVVAFCALGASVKVTFLGFRESCTRRTETRSRIWNGRFWVLNIISLIAYAVFLLMARWEDEAQKHWSNHWDACGRFDPSN